GCCPAAGRRRPAAPRPRSAARRHRPLSAYRSPPGPPPGIFTPYDGPATDSGMCTIFEESPREYKTGSLKSLKVNVDRMSAPGYHQSQGRSLNILRGLLNLAGEATPER